MESDLLNQSAFLTPLLSGIILGLLSPLVGMFLVVRRFSLLADTLAHISLLGVALAMLWRLPLSLGAFLTAVLGGWGIEKLRESRRILSEASLAVFLSGSLALALMLFAFQEVNGDEIESVLFGNLASVGRVDFSLLFLVAFIVIGFFLLAYRKLFVIALDEDLARVDGIPVVGFNTFFMLVASGVVGIAIKIVGVLLVSALIVIPVLAAMQWRQSFFHTLLLSIGFSELAVLTGFGFAWSFHLPSGATIVLLALALFVFSYLLHLPKKA